MKTLLFFATLSLVMWLILGSNETRREYDEDKVIEKMLDPVKRMQCQNPGVCIIIFLVIYRNDTIQNDTRYKNG